MLTSTDSRFAPRHPALHFAGHPERKPQPARRRAGGAAALSASIALHAAIAVYLLQATFEPRYREYGEEVTSVELVRVIPPPPPPPPPPPETPRAAPPKLQPRPPTTVVNLPLSIPPLPIPPVEERLEPLRPPPVIAPTAPAPAPPPEPAKPAAIQNPDWLRRPSADDMARFYPDRAERMNIEGRATIACTVDAKGALQACGVVSETPDDQDFGQAALRMSKLFRMRPMTVDGEPVAGGTVRIPIRFVLPQA